MGIKGEYQNLEDAFCALQRKLPGQSLLTSQDGLIRFVKLSDGWSWSHRLGLVVTHHPGFQTMDIKTAFASLEEFIVPFQKTGFKTLKQTADYVDLCFNQKFGVDTSVVLKNPHWEKSDHINYSLGDSSLYLVKKSGGWKVYYYEEDLKMPQNVFKTRKAALKALFDLEIL